MCQITVILSYFQYFMLYEILLLLHYYIKVEGFNCTLSYCILQITHFLWNIPLSARSCYKCSLFNCSLNMFAWSLHIYCNFTWNLATNSTTKIKPLEIAYKSVLISLCHKLHLSVRVTIRFIYIHFEICHISISILHSLLLKWPVWNNSSSYVFHILSYHFTSESYPHLERSITMIMIFILY